MKKALAASILAAALLAPPPFAGAEEPKPPPAHLDEATVMVDLLLVRPLGLAAVVAGAILYLPAAFVTSWGGNDIRPVADLLIHRPASFTFNRPLGRFEGD